MNEFTIGDVIFENKTNKSGVIVDKLYSHQNECNLYFIKPNDGGRSFTRREDEIQMIIKDTTYRAITEIADNTVIAVIYETKGGVETECCRGHAHIIHEGAEGVAQACSYAYKMAFSKIDSGIYRKQLNYWEGQR